MSKQTVLEIAARIFGLYCIVQFFQSIPAIIAAIVVPNRELISNKTLHIVLTSLYPLVFLALAYIFLVKSDTITKITGSQRETAAGTEFTYPENEALYNKLHFWILILGIGYFISAISSILLGMGTLSYKLKNGWFIAHDPVLPQAITLILSLLYIFRSEQIAKFIETRRNNVSNRVPSEADVSRR